MYKYNTKDITQYVIKLLMLHVIKYLYVTRDI